MKAWIVLIGIAMVSMIAVAVQTKKDTTDGFEAYSLILERNVFDSTRKPPKKEVVRKSTPTPPPKPKAKIIQVVGTAVTEGGAIAFLESSITSYDGMVKTGDKRGDLTVGKIAAETVSVVIAEKEHTIPVGASLTDQGSGEWKVDHVEQPKQVAPKKDSMDADLEDLWEDM